MQQNTKNKMNFHKLKQTLCMHNANIIENNRNKLRNKDCDSTKSNLIENYKNQIEDTPRTKCPICKKLKFGKNMLRIIHGLE